MINIFPLLLNSDPQILPITGGASGSLVIRLQFETLPSAGFISIEARRPGSDSWFSIHNNVAIPVTSIPPQFLLDGGTSALRVTLVGLSGGASPSISVTGNDTATPPSELLTDGGYGASRRLRVDPGQTGFFAGRFFRSYIEALVPVAGPSVQFRFTSPVDFILWLQSLELTQGATELRVYTGATPSGTWGQRPVIGVNRMAQRPQPYYSAQCTLEIGAGVPGGFTGSFTGGAEVDVLKVRTSAANNTAQNVGDSWTERGLPAGTYYGRLQTLAGGLNVNDPAQLIYALTWEERP
jgi:hypothetical protein